MVKYLMDILLENSLHFFFETMNLNAIHPTVTFLERSISMCHGNSAYKFMSQVQGAAFWGVLLSAHFLDEVNLCALRQPPSQVSGQNLIRKILCEYFQCIHVSTVVVMNTST